ncbi:MAG: hypothetical protein JWM78_1892 [Verrucomicrobiaceae bacterium]|nr:hypothetical protein [Verrucomicrobiaceae bacterium]
MSKDIDPDATWMSTSTLMTRHLALGLLYRGHEYSLLPADTPFVIGRDDSSNLCVSNEYSSRRHCAIEFRDAKFVLCDDSTNGTYLRLGRAENLRVHREAAPLAGRGCFKLGKNFGSDDPDLIHFVIRETLAAE